jgi:hypothetical protein
MTKPLELVLFTTVLIISLIAGPDPGAAQEEQGQGESKTVQSEKTPEKSSSQNEQPKTEETQYNAGLFFGHVLAIDPAGRSVFVKPIERHYSRKDFYLDNKTRYTSFVDGKRKKRKLQDLLEGQKVAIRYFANEHLAVADEIFFVTGEFEPAAYEKQKVRKVGQSPKAGKPTEHGAKH